MQAIIGRAYVVDPLRQVMQPGLVVLGLQFRAELT